MSITVDLKFKQGDRFYTVFKFYNGHRSIREYIIKSIEITDEGVLYFGETCHKIFNRFTGDKALSYDELVEYLESNFESSIKNELIDVIADINVSVFVKNYVKDSYLFERKEITNEN